MSAEPPAQGGASADGCAAIPLPGLARLMPMHLWIGPGGAINSMGGTLAKVLGDQVRAGAPFDAHFRVRRARFQDARAVDPPPQDLTAAALDLASGAEGRLDPRAWIAAGRGVARLYLELAARPDIALRGVATPLGQGGGMLVNLTFGIQIAEAVREFGLTESDFAASDLAIELLYLNEANAVALGELNDLTARLDMERRTALAQSMTDPLTGLANRRAFDRAIAEELRAQSEGRRAFAVAQVDLDYFKQVNDAHGHATGDRVLAAAARRIAGELRHDDLVARIGGDEFLLLLRGADKADPLRRLGERLISALEEPIVVDGVACRISASVGIAISRDAAGMDAAALMAAADRALYAAKRAGRGRCALDDGPAA